MVQSQNFIWRLRLFVGGELIRLGAWINPSSNSEDAGCDEPAEWAIYGKRPDDVTYSCTEHLPDMITSETYQILFNEQTGLNCHYLYSTSELTPLVEINA